MCEDLARLLKNEAKLRSLLREATILLETLPGSSAGHPDVTVEELKQVLESTSETLARVHRIVEVHLAWHHCDGSD